MYLSKSKLGELEIKFSIQNRIFGILAGVFLICTLAGLFPAEGQEFDLGMAIFDACTMTLCLIKIILNVYKYQRYKYARRVNNVFENDPDRVMTFEELANALHLPKDTVKKDVLWLIDNGVITNCRFDDNNPNLIILEYVEK